MPARSASSRQIDDHHEGDQHEQRQRGRPGLCPWPASPAAGRARGGAWEPARPRPGSWRRRRCRRRRPGSRARAPGTASGGGTGWTADGRSAICLALRSSTSVTPSWSWSPGSRRVGPWIPSPFTNVPLREPRSSTTAPDPRGRDPRVAARHQLVGQDQVGVLAASDGHAPRQGDHPAGAGSLHDLQAQLGHADPSAQVPARQPATPVGRAACPSARASRVPHSPWCRTAPWPRPGAGRPAPGAPASGPVATGCSPGRP